MLLVTTVELSKMGDDDDWGVVRVESASREHCFSRVWSWKDVSSTGVPRLLGLFLALLFSGNQEDCIMLLHARKLAVSRAFKTVARDQFPHVRRNDSFHAPLSTHVRLCIFNQVGCSYVFKWRAPVNVSLFFSSSVSRNAHPRHCPPNGAVRFVT